MKIAVLQREGRVFPRCEEGDSVAMVDIDARCNSVEQTTFLARPERAMSNLAAWLQELRVDVVLTSGIRQWDRDQIEAKGIQVIAGVPPFRIEPVIANFLAGTLETEVTTGDPPTAEHE